MYKNILANDKQTQDVVIETPLDDYELLDFGNGRKLESFGPYVLDRPDTRASGKPKHSDWQADWIFGRPGSGTSGWKPARKGLPAYWELTIDGMRLRCIPSDKARVGINLRDIACQHWIRERMSGCYDIDDLCMLNLFAGSGVLSAAGLQAGAVVTHVDSSQAMLDLSQRNVGEKNIRYECFHVPTYVEGAQLRGDNFHFIAISPPRIGKGHNASWDIEVDLAHLIKNLPKIVSRQCRGIWVHVDAGFWTPPSVAQMLREALPGCTVEMLQLGIATADGRVLPAGGAARWYDHRDDLLSIDGQLSFTVAEVEEHLDVYLDAALSSRRTAAAPARQIAELQRSQQDFALRWISVIAHTNGEMAYQLASFITEAFQLMDESVVEEWIIHSMDVYDRLGLRAGIASLRQAEKFAKGTERTGIRAHI